jgi:hypothetical protein
MLKARLHPLSRGHYSVLFNGRLIVEGSRDPECDAARALVKRGHRGLLHMLDGKTGKPRTIVDIEKAARLRTVETGNAPRFRNLTCAESPYSPETETKPGEAAGHSTEAA